MKYVWETPEEIDKALAVAQDCADELRSLFSNVAYRNMEEVLREHS